MERAVLVYTTWPSIVEAEQAGRAIVERRWAACVNIVPGMISHYWWQGKLARAGHAGSYPRQPQLCLAQSCVYRRYIVFCRLW